MDNISFQDGKIVLDATKSLSKMSKYQKWNLKKLINKNGVNEVTQNYLRSFISDKKIRSYEVSFLKLKKNEQKIESGRFLEIQKSMINSAINHKPNEFSKHSDYVGVEIECLIPKFESDDAVDCGCMDSDCSTCYMTEHESRRELIHRFDKQYKIKYVSVKDDGSIKDKIGYFSCEVTVLTRLSDLSNLKRVCEVLNKLGAKVNSSCGMHIHLDARKMDEQEVKNVGIKFSRALPVLSKMLPKSRLNNHYCKIGVSALRGSRYYAVNLTAYKKYKTIEIRAHSSTTDFDKIVNWIKLCDAIKNAHKIKNCSDINELTDFIKIDENLLEYVTQRTFMFSSDANIVNTVYRDNDAA